MTYFKILGGIIIILTSVVLGISIVRQNNAETEEIKKTIRFYEDFKSQIEYNSNDVATAIINSLKNTDFVHKNAFEAFAKKLSDSNTLSFTKAWDKCIKSDFLKSTIQLLEDFSSDLRAGDANEYKACADRQISQLSKTLSRKQNQNKQNNKLTLYISALSGFFIVVVLI